MSESGDIKETVFLSLVEAARSIPCEVIPFSFLGSRFAMIIIFFPFRSS